MEEEYSPAQLQTLAEKIETDISELTSFLSTESGSQTVELDQSRLGRLAPHLARA